ncbi:YheC/YheD family protein [Neobacillus sp. FSL H8-0543]|uniref:YheC/YheD family endospore coat-associated protein n=1 Tax=Neobacillus sp. FSL H8-0543 TaxID=2954672 RepID=UPI0031589B5A
MKYIIKTISIPNPTISLPLAVLEKLEISERNSIIISIGAIKETVTLMHHDNRDQCIYLSNAIYKKFLLPEFIDAYEIKVENEILQIGPVIGMLIRGKIDELTKQRIKIYKNYLIDYKHLNGLILLFTTDGIDVKNKLIYGYAFNPKEHEWEEGIFPFPSVVFLRRPIKESIRKKLFGLIGNKFFNSHVFNKWEMWEWLSDNEQIRKYLPETVLCENIENVQRLIDAHKETFIKPMAGMQGAGIFQLSKVGQEFNLCYRVKGKNIITVFDTWEAVEYYLRSEISLKNYIVQQRIPLLTKENRVMDVRVIVGKNHNGDWIVPGMITKFGDKDSIVSNISSGGSAQKVWKSLCETFQDDYKKAFKKYMEIEGLALTCCKVLEGRGLHLGYIGIDIGMDENHNLWLIEINNRSPDMTIALDADDFQLYYKIKSAPLHYAKWLSSFGGERRGGL